MVKVLEKPAKTTGIIVTPIIGSLVDNDTLIKCKCAFCQKVVVFSNKQKVVNDILTNGRGFYCNFCIRNNYHTKYNKNILILSFRGIIGFYYYCRYRVSPISTYISEIKDYVDLHEEIGMKNPVFNYDPETYCWFIDFSKVGKSSRQVRVRNVLSTVLEILASFNLYSCYYDFKGHELYKRYSDAILEFYEKKSRPSDKRILIPTLTKCAEFKTDLKTVTIENTRNFLPSDLVIYDRFKAT